MESNWLKKPQNLQTLNHLKPDKINHEQVTGSVINRFTEKIYMYCQFADYYVCKQTIKRKNLTALIMANLTILQEEKNKGRFSSMANVLNSMLASLSLEITTSNKMQPICLRKWLSTLVSG